MKLLKMTQTIANKMLREFDRKMTEFYHDVLELCKRAVSQSICS